MTFISGESTALALINELMKNDRLNEFGTNLAFIFTPAEEFVDLNWRKKHKLAGDFTYFGGKQEAIKLGVFDDIDYCVVNTLLVPVILSSILENLTFQSPLIQIISNTFDGLNTTS